jgi:EpsI family protein
VLLVQGVALNQWPTPPDRPLKAPLTTLPARLEEWVATREMPIDPTIAAALNADDTLNREYFNPARNASANLFIAYFGASTYGRWPHSPQQCMPGAGWDQRSLTTVTVPIASVSEPFRVTRFILAKDNREVVVHYWYESHGRAVATEYLAKIHLVLDSIRYRRSDTSLVRVTTSVPDPSGMDAGIQDGVRFVQACLNPVRALVN